MSLPLPCCGRCRAPRSKIGPGLQVFGIPCPLHHDLRGGRLHVAQVIRREFDDRWSTFTQEEQRAINDAIDEKLDELVAGRDSRGGSIMNTSIEGGKVNPFNGRPGDW